MVFTVSFKSVRFTYVDYVYFLGQLEAARRLGEPRLVVKFDGVTGFYPDGMVPFLASVHQAERQGLTISVEPRQDSELRAMWKAMGWTGQLFGLSPPLRSGSGFLPVVSYSSGPELNAYLNQAIDSLAESEVLAPGVLTGFEWCANEVADNVLVHAQTLEPGLMQMLTIPKQRQVEFVVADTGRGIRESLSESYSGLPSDQQAVALAIERGITRSRTVGLGNRLSGTVRIASANSGYVNIHSGRGQIRVLDGDVHQSSAVRHQGTIVTVTLSTDSEVDVSEALWGHQPVPAFEAKYVDAQGLQFSVAQEANYLGNRHTAQVLRARLVNLAIAHDDELVFIDFEGVNMVSASFIDEFVGLLAVEVGIGHFNSRFSLVNVSPYVAAAIEGGYV